MIATLAALTASLLLPAERSDVCALPALENLSCVSTPAGAVIGAAPQEGLLLARTVTAAEGRFALRFGRPAAPYAVLVGQTPLPATGALAASGVVNLLPWVSETKLIAVFQQSILDQMRQTGELQSIARNLGVNEAELEVNFEPAIPPATIAAHELGHLWFQSAFPSPASMRDVVRYGSAWPDWLDEAAAVSVEGEASAEKRRAEFSAALKGEGPAPEPLAVFLTRVHPNHEAQEPAAANPAEAVELGRFQMPDGTPVTASVQWNGEGHPTGLFYPQVQVFSDFLFARTGDATVLGGIAEAIAEGRGFDAWLAESQVGRRLGGSMRGLETAWRAWLESEYGRSAP